jgi:hypothetical protein
MKRFTFLIVLSFFLVVALSLISAPAPVALTVDSSAAALSTLPLYKGNGRTVRATYYDDGVVTDLTNGTPYMKWATNSTAALVYTSSYSFVYSTASGKVDFAFTGAQLWTNGNFLYEVGVLYGTTNITYGQGVFKIIDTL